MNKLKELLNKLKQKVLSVVEKVKILLGFNPKPTFDAGVAANAHIQSYTELLNEFKEFHKKKSSKKKKPKKSNTKKK